MTSHFHSEEWREIPSIPFLLASSLGRVKLAVRIVPMPRGGFRESGGKPTYGTWRDGRYECSFRGKSYKVHRLVCEAFNGPCPEGMICCHEDENGRNNLPGNLVWSTQKHNLNAPGFLAYCRARTGDQNPNRKGRALRSIRSSDCDQPCRPDCPAGDCAGCVFPSTPARCVATACPQADRCHRAALARVPDDVEIDPSCATRGGDFCPMFIDRRGAALLAGAAC